MSLDGNGVTAYAVYQEALKRVADKRADHKDQVIISLWQEGRKMMAQRLELKETIKVLERKLREAEFYVDILETRAAVPVDISEHPSLEVYANWLRGEVPSADILALH